MYKLAKVISATETEALILFEDLKIQASALIMTDVVVAPGDRAVVIFQDDITSGLIIGILAA